MPVLDLLPVKKKKAPKGMSTPPPSAPRYEPPLIPSSHPVPPRLVRKLAALGRKYLFVNSAEKIVLYVTAAVMLLTVQMFLDWLVELNVVVRAVFLAADILLLLFFIRKQLVPLLLHPPNQEACALMVEKHWTRFHGRMIATVQFAKPRFTVDSPALIQAVQQETDSKTGALNFGDIISTRLLKRRAMTALVVLALAGGLMYLTLPGSIALLERVFLLPAKVPRKTEVICLSGNKTIPAGDSVVLEAQARGIIPSHGLATLVDDTGRIQEITMDPEPGRPDHFSLKVDQVGQPMTYTIRLGDGSSGSYQIKTLPRPAVLTLDCEQIYPAYTQLPPAKRTVGNLALLIGSKLTLDAKTNTTITKAALKLIGIDKVIPLKIGGQDGRELTGELDIPATGLSGFSIELTDQAGITSGDETQYRIDLITDHPPTIVITDPQELQELDTLVAKPKISFTAGDDYGLAKISFCYRIVSDDVDQVDANGTPIPPPAPSRIAMDLDTSHPVLTMQNAYVIDLAGLKPHVAEGNSLEFWLEAQDANNVTGPGTGESEHHIIKVVTPAEKAAEVRDRLLSILSTVSGIATRETRVNGDLSTVLQNSSNTNAPNPNSPPPK
ncbi:MAG: DUF4175 domain-containing protein [Methylacidiphilales bacterium]|nr:DUF4175 domain-containing protein [Candidatus Methylacidiphilales bacterium]